jgi:L-fuconolactonase
MTDDLAQIRRPFGPENLRPLLADRGVTGTILVQTRSSVDETREFLAVAASTEFIAGVVGWIDLTDPAAADAIAELRAGPGGMKLVGIRHQVHDEEDPDWLSRPDVRRGLRAVERAGLAYDLLVRARELPAAMSAAQALPGLRFVVDHAAKPPIREGRIEPWASLLARTGAAPNVACKISGLVTEADWDRWRPADLVPYVDHALEVFGSERLMFGSDWPVCLLAGSYAQILDAARFTLRDLTDAERSRIFGGTAGAVYGLAQARPDAALSSRSDSGPLLERTP